VVLVAQALFQLRFSDLASIPIAILVGCWLAPLLVKFIPSCRLRIPLGLLAVALLQATTVAETIERIGYRHEDRGSVESWRLNGVRSLHEWLAANAEGNGSVLAHWDQGHALEFVAGRASVATNFGSYVGEESFRAPAEFFTASTWEEGEEILDRHRCDYVLVHSAIPSAWSQLKAVAGTSTAQWRNSLAAALTHSGGPPAPPRLRLVFVSPFKDPQPDSRLAAAFQVDAHLDTNSRLWRCGHPQQCAFNALPNHPHRNNFTSSSQTRIGLWILEWADKNKAQSGRRRRSPGMGECGG